MKKQAKLKNEEMKKNPKNGSKSWNIFCLFFERGGN